MFEALRQVVYQVSDIAAARDWYRDILRTEPVIDTPFVVHFRVGNAGLTLARRPADAPSSGGSTVGYWEVRNIDEDYARLVARGATPLTEVANVLGTRRGTVIDPFGNVIGLLGAAVDKSTRTVEEEPSGTAQIVATLRAFAATDEREWIRGPDTMAEIFITGDRKQILHDAASRAWVLKHAVPSGMYEFIAARTVYFDEAVAQALRDGVPQLVFLGAGYDSRPYRFRDLAHDTRIFEVDAAPTQTRKRAVLAEADVPVPPNLSYVSIHFEKDSLSESLLRAGYDPLRRSLFVWEGVMYYLTADAVDSTFEFIQGQSPPGSKIVFDYHTASESSLDVQMSPELRRRMRSDLPSEPIQFRIDQREIGPFLSQRGFLLVEHLTAQEMERRYLMNSEGISAGRVLDMMALATAENAPGSA